MLTGGGRFYGLVGEMFVGFYCIWELVIGSDDDGENSVVG
jgi:hypothetical protein